MELLINEITQLTGTVNQLLGRLTEAERQLRTIGNNALNPVVEENYEIPLQAPQNEADLLAIARLPDSVEELTVFEGEPAHYVS